ncbi:hypothetical protein B0H17DRAFT_44036 [Mycena rosella]|uniref:Uncharacterized protein n=1 Tax=Mycena rosella TaxID=1033263 RepID=A0AAD7DAU0_MYCRO|nr:hypothetical protein B0H17DRAFT_44036 [Mycena rosella]
MWIRPSTGRLCVDLTANDDGSLDLYHLIQMASSSTAVSVLQPPEDSIIVDSLSLDGYHEICYFHLEHSRQLSISTKVSVQLGAVILCPPGSEVQLSNEIAYIPDPDVIESGWRVSTGASMIVLESGWTRVDSSEAPHAHISHENFLGNQSWHSKAWLAQANYIFHCLSITSKHNNYVLVHSINYILRLATSNSIPPGYLFLCPLANLQADSPSCFQLAECPAYWSLDPTGDERLSMVEAEQLGFPSFKLEMMVDGDSWAENVYTGIYQFHQAKGFDLDSQDVARELGLPIFEISTGLGSPFAHIQETDLCDRPETQEPLDTELPQEPVHGESGLHCLPLPLLASTSATAHQMNYFGVYAQGSAIDESFDPHLFGSSAPSTRHSQNFNNSNLNFEFPFRDQPYHLPPLEPSTLPQFITPPHLYGPTSPASLLSPHRHHIPARPAPSPRTSINSPQADPASANLGTMTRRTILIPMQGGRAKCRSARIYGVYKRCRNLLFRGTGTGLAETIGLGQAEAAPETNSFRSSFRWPLTVSETQKFRRATSQSSSFSFNFRCVRTLHFRVPRNLLIYRVTTVGVEGVSYNAGGISGTYFKKEENYKKLISQGESGRCDVTN